MCGIGAPNSVARYLSEHDFGQNKFIVLERVNGELRMIAGQTTLESAEKYMLPGRTLVDVDNCHIVREVERGDIKLQAFCVDLDGSMKAELFTMTEHNPLSREQFGPVKWMVWDKSSPFTSRHFLGETEARRAFKSAMIHGTNGYDC